MSIYSRILLALDLSDESEQLAMKTAEMAKAFGAELNLIHVSGASQLCLWRRCSHGPDDHTGAA